MKQPLSQYLLRRLTSAYSLLKQVKEHMKMISKEIDDEMKISAPLQLITSSFHSSAWSLVLHGNPNEGLMVPALILESCPPPRNLHP